MYRNIVTDFWTDSKVERMSSFGKLLMLYILTAPHGNLSGCFEVTFRRIEIETGLTAQQAKKAMKELCAEGMLAYRVETSEVLIRNWWKYNWNSSPKTGKSLAKCIDSVKDDGFKSELVDRYNAIFKDPYPYPIDTPSIHHGYHPISVSVTDTVSDTEESTSNTSQVETKRHRYGEFLNVLLTDSELEKLKERFPNDWERRINDLSYYIGSKGDKYKSHYRTILNWNRKNEEPKEAKRDSYWQKYD
ncbi:MAG: hypothetical protein IJ111_01470 [Eggerthellaceae bacterium]|nr:hypothetical protein [Eggerthellaceae bacterium]